jgi:hypothetical protein
MTLFGHRPNLEGVIWTFSKKESCCGLHSYTGGSYRRKGVSIGLPIFHSLKVYIGDFLLLEICFFSPPSGDYENTPIYIPIRGAMFFSYFPLLFPTSSLSASAYALPLCCASALSILSPWPRRATHISPVLPFLRSSATLVLVLSQRCTSSTTLAPPDPRCSLPLCCSRCSPCRRRPGHGRSSSLSLVLVMNGFNRLGHQEGTLWMGGDGFIFFVSCF